MRRSEHVGCCEIKCLDSKCYWLINNHTCRQVGRVGVKIFRTVSLLSISHQTQKNRKWTFVPLQHSDSVK